MSLVRNVRTATDNHSHHIHSLRRYGLAVPGQVFQTSSQAQPTWQHDAVVSNAGVADLKAKFNEPQNLDMDDPPKPDMPLFYLPRNPSSQPADPNKSTSKIEESPRDRHLLLVGSMASLLPIPQQTLYGAAKHGVLGLFRSLRITAFAKGVRVNMICPYFADTGILTPPGRILPAGAHLAQLEDVVEASSRLIADSRIRGRNLVVGPRLRIVKQNKANGNIAGKKRVKMPWRLAYGKSAPYDLESTCACHSWPS
ncbi:hypothetical protein V1522DRAFT_389220 [Lipomyces starkeyi]